MAQEVIIEYKAKVDQLTRELEAVVQANEKLNKSQDQTQKELDQTVKSVQNLEKEFADTGKSLDKSTKNVQDFSNKAKSEMSGLGASVKSVGIGIAGALAAAFSSDAIKRFATAAIQEFAKFQSQTIAFETLIGDAVTARKLLAELEEFSVRTPFTPDQVISAARALSQFGIETDKIKETVKILGDVSAGTGKDLTELAIIFGQIQSTGRLMSQDLLQLINAGFNPLQVISEQTGKSMAELKVEMEKGAISADMITEAFKTATSEGGKFFNLTDKLADSVEGQVSTIQGQIDQLLRGIGAKLAPAFLEIQRFGLRVLKTISDLFGVKIQTAVEKTTEELQKVGTEFNLLANTIQRGNLTAEQRVALITEINEKYGQYLPNLLDEKSSLEEIAAAQKSVNEEIQRRITIIALEEEIQRITKNAVAATKTLLDVEKERQKLREDFTIDNAAAAEAQRKQLDRDEALANAIIENSKKQIEELTARFTALGGALFDAGNAAAKSTGEAARISGELIREIESIGVNYNLLIRYLRADEAQKAIIDIWKAAAESTDKFKEAVARAQVQLNSLPDKLELPATIKVDLELAEPTDQFTSAEIRDSVFEVLEVTSGIQNDLISLWNNYTNQRIEQIEKEKQAQLDAIDENFQAVDDDLKKRRISEAEAERRREELRNERIETEKKATEKERQIKRQQAILDKAAAIFEITLNTAIAISKATATGPFSAAALQALYAAQGAAQIAAVAAAPIPYAKGSKNTKEGLARVGEQGEEIVYMPGKSKVLPSRQTRTYGEAIDAMFDNKFDKYVNKTYVVPALERQKRAYEESRQQSFAQNVADSMVMTLTGPNVQRVKGKVSIENMQELASLIQQGRQSVYRS